MAPSRKWLPEAKPLWLIILHQSRFFESLGSEESPPPINLFYGHFGSELITGSLKRMKLNLNSLIRALWLSPAAAVQLDRLFDVRGFRRIGDPRVLEKGIQRIVAKSGIVALPDPCTQEVDVFPAGVRGEASIHLHADRPRFAVVAPEPVISARERNGFSCYLAIVCRGHQLVKKVSGDCKIREGVQPAVDGAGEGAAHINGAAVRYSGRRVGPTFERVDGDGIAPF